MISIKTCELADETLLASFLHSDAYTDCYCTFIPGSISQAAYIEGFYTTWLFKLERLILKWLVGRPSTDEEAKELAQGDIKKFAAWRVERRNEYQLLMCDFQNRTRSWFMTAPGNIEGIDGTILYFGSAVVSKTNPKTGKSSLGLVFTLLLGFHKIYSRALLHCARSRLRINSVDD